jgi:hypothetical protein
MNYWIKIISENYSRLFLGIFLTVMLAFVLVSSLHPAASTAISEPLLTVTSDTITRSISSPFLDFMGQQDSNLTQSITWHQNGSTNISDNIGDSLTITVPVLTGTTLTILQNSTTVDQKLTTPSLQYDIYWKPLQNTKGITDRYKFSIIGTSTNGTEIQFPVKSSENLVVTENKILATPSSSDDFTASNQANSTTRSLGIDWSDAISAGYNVQLDASSGSVNVLVGNSFSIDPTVVATGVPNVSPTSTDSYEGERRIVNIGGNLFAFYFDGSNLVYRNSTNDGFIWSTSHLVWTGTGSIADDPTRWTIGSTTKNNHQYVSVVYWHQTGSNVIINYTMGNASNPSSLISWHTAKTLLSLPSKPAYVAANEANDTSGNLFLVVRWLNSTSNTYEREIFKSTNGGLTFSASGSATVTSYTTKPEYVLTGLANGNMLMVQARYQTSDLQYSVYSSSNSSWHNLVTLTGTGMTANATKQISADSNTTKAAYVAYVTGNASGTLKVARWSSNGAFNSFETANSTLSHALPSITITRDNVIRIYTLASGIIYETDKVGSTWLASANPFGQGWCCSRDQLTSGILYPVALWRELGAFSQFNLMYGEKSWHSNTGILEPLYCDPYDHSGVSSTCTSSSTFKWQSVNDTKNRYPHVPLFVIVNPDSGPGFGNPPNCASEWTNRTRDYNNGIGNLTKAGVIVLGYVWSDPIPAHFGHTNLNWVEGNITNWVNCYPKIKGIFLDGMPSFTEDGNQTYYTNISKFIHNNESLAYSFGNPGNDLLKSYQGTVDQTDIYENYHNDTLNFAAPFTNSTLQGNGVPGNPPNWHMLYDKSTYSFLQYNKTSITQQGVQNESVYVRFMYFTDNTGCGPHHPAKDCYPNTNPWNTTASYLGPMTSYLNNPSVLSTIQARDKSSGNLIHILNMTISQSKNLVRNGTTPFTYNETLGWQFNFTAPKTNSTYHFCYWTFPGTNTTNKSIQVAPSTSNTYNATYSLGC